MTKDHKMLMASKGFSKTLFYMLVYDNNGTLDRHMYTKYQYTTSMDAPVRRACFKFYKRWFGQGVIPYKVRLRWEIY